MHRVTCSAENHRVTGVPDLREDGERHRRTNIIVLSGRCGDVPNVVDGGGSLKLNGRPHRCGVGTVEEDVSCVLEGCSAASTNGFSDDGLAEEVGLGVEAVFEEEPSEYLHLDGDVRGPNETSVGVVVG